MQAPCRVCTEARNDSPQRRTSDRGAGRIYCTHEDGNESEAAHDKTRLSRRDETRRKVRRRVSMPTRGDYAARRYTNLLLIPRLEVSRGMRCAASTALAYEPRHHPAQSSHLLYATGVPRTPSGEDSSSDGRQATSGPVRLDGAQCRPGTGVPSDHAKTQDRRGGQQSATPRKSFILFFGLLMPF